MVLNLKPRLNLQAGYKRRFTNPSDEAGEGLPSKILFFLPLRIAQYTSQNLTPQRQH